MNIQDNYLIYFKSKKIGRFLITNYKKKEESK